MKKNEIVIFETEDRSVTLPVAIENETVWLNRKQMAELFDQAVGRSDTDYETDRA